MTDNSDIHHRRSIRLPGYDYSRAGAYFITICTQGRKCLFGDVAGGKMVLNEYGTIVANEWENTARIRDEIELDEWVVMPNHFHGIVLITGNDRMGDRCCRGDRPVAPTIDPVVPTGPRPRSLGALMAGFKSAVTKRVNETRNTSGVKLWQRNYWEHIVRNDHELNRIRTYIRNNPAQWETDKLYPYVGVREPDTKYTVAEAWMV